MNNIQWKLIKTSEVIDKPNIPQVLFELYKKSYPNAWFADKEVLLSAYRCILIGCMNHKIIAYLMLEPTSLGMKISLSATDGTDFAKQIQFNKRAQLLVTPGYYQEASGAVSWSLRSRYRLYPITEEKQIRKILEDKIDRGDIITMNQNYDYHSPKSQVYTRSVTDKNTGKTFHNEESIFGMPCSIGLDTNNFLFKGFMDHKLSGTDCNQTCEMIVSSQL